ncbi:sensor histidine kinase [Bizionia sp.]|uniref:sensor histidine kinase n=1 Tax=Bizionia sp. TaxID=1954480 RepID=UPI003A8E6833
MISLTCLGVSLVFHDSFFGTSILIAFLILQTVFLISYINQVNKKIAFFFEALKNDDFSLNFPEYSSGSILDNLTKNINAFNRKIERIHAENSAQENYYKTLLNQANIGIFTVNEEGTILFKNSKLKELLNYSSLNNIRQIKSLNEYLFHFIDTSKNSNKTLIEFTNERETVQLIVKIAPFKSFTNTIKLITVQDIKQELDKNKTDSWMRLIKVMTHEIMNSVAPITSIADSLLRYYEPTNTSPIQNFSETEQTNISKGLNVIKTQSKNLLRFVDSYRSYISVPLPEKSIFKVHTLLVEVHNLMQPEANKKGVSFSVTSTPTELELFADRQQINQVLINLVQNSIQALKTNNTIPCKITIEAGIHSSNKKFIRVTDNGPGVPEEFIDDIFVPFFTTKEQGTGIGLSLSKQIMHLHDGNILLHSKENDGTSFTLLF